MSLKDYREAWHKKYADTNVEFGFNSVAGYTTALVLEKALATAPSLDQLELRKAIFSLSGNLKTLAPQGFRVEGHELTLYGVCPDCRAGA